MKHELKKFSALTAEDAQKILKDTFEFDLKITSINVINKNTIEIETVSEWTCEENNEELTTEQEDYLELTPFQISGMDFASGIADQNRYRKSLIVHGYISDDQYQAILNK